jgi:protein gp37
MAENSKIEWTHHTFNPWIGCQRVSPGCENCYAESYDKRVGGTKMPDGSKALRWGPKAPRVVTSAANWRKPLKWNAEAEAAGERHRVFCASLADVFEDRPELAAPRARLHALIRDMSHLDWLLLTKRPENAGRLWAQAHYDAFDGSESLGPTWAPNVWLGTTAEDQRRADERLPHLLAVDAAVRFVSYEPALERVDFSRWIRWRITTSDGSNFPHTRHVHELPAVGGSRGIDWLIVGGESGPGARPFDIAWARSAVEQCKAAGVPVFVKQLGAKPVDREFNMRSALDAARIGEDLGAHEVDEDAPMHLYDRKGGDMAEWPEDLRVREWPEVRR